MRFEGLKYIVYSDTLGLKTCGIGHLLTPADGHYELGQSVTQEQIDKWYASDIIAAITIAKKCINNYDSLDDVRQRILVNLAFNMGNKLLQFKNTLKAVQNRQFGVAAEGLRNSKWFTQVGKRGPAMADAMALGYYSV
jgi:lysozyme